jgi:Domain of unknown function (DUF4166)/Saccharopine dehydrogenase NADP binding domain
MRRALVLGGYGGFGARLSRRLAIAGWQIIIAGRNLNSAERLARVLPNAVAAIADRNGDLGALLDAHRPQLLIDAAGPFQGSGYQVAEACLKAGIAYLDLADARDFVSGSLVLDARARAVGVTVILGASSVPALSGAVVRHLVEGFDRLEGLKRVEGLERVNSIEMAISASNKASAGLSVAAAILGGVGRPVKLWTGCDWRSEAGWSDLRWTKFAVSGKPALRRLVALADVPDHQLLPGRIAGNPAVTFRAGPEFAWQTIALWLLGWLVRLRIVRSLSGLSSFAKRLQAFLSGCGSDCSAMSVVLTGQVGDRHIMRRWTLLAENGDGPEIPVLAAQLLAEKIATGEAPVGACDAGDLLTLKDFAALFAQLAVSTEFHEQTLVPLYKRIMGARFDQLPQPVRALHDLCGAAAASGEAEVIRGSSPLAKLICALMGFPPTGQYPLTVYFEVEKGVEQWTRHFGRHCFASALSEANGQLVERFGPMRFCFDLSSSEQGLSLMMRGWSIFHQKMPLWLAPRTQARESAQGGEFNFDVRMQLPLVGPLVQYRGRLQRNPR